MLHDMEVGLGSMYEDTPMNLRACTDGKIDISDVQEDFSHAEEDGMVGVDFYSFYSDTRGK